MLGGQWINAGGTETKTYKTAFWRCQCFAPVVSAVACLISTRGLNQPHHTPNAAIPSEGGGIAKRIKTARLRRKTKPSRPAHNCSIILNISHLTRTRSIASLPCKIVLGDLIPLFSKKSFCHQGFFAVKRRAVFNLGAMWNALVRGWRRDCVVGGMETRFQ